MLVAIRTPPSSMLYGEVAAGGLAGRRDRPHGIADQSKPLGAATVEGRLQSSPDLGFDRFEPVAVERLGAGGHLGVVEAEFLLEADQLQEAARHAGESELVFFGGVPAVLGDRIELVFEPEDRLVVVERSGIQLREHEVGIGCRFGVVRLRIDRKHVSHGRRQLGLGHRLALLSFRAS